MQGFRVIPYRDPEATENCPASVAHCYRTWNHFFDGDKEGGGAHGRGPLQYRTPGKMRENALFPGAVLLVVDLKERCSVLNFPVPGGGYITFLSQEVS